MAPRVVNIKLPGIYGCSSPLSDGGYFIANLIHPKITNHSCHGPSNLHDLPIPFQNAQPAWSWYWLTFSLLVQLPVRFQTG